LTGVLSGLFSSGDVDGDAGVSDFVPVTVATAAASADAAEAIMLRAPATSLVAVDAPGTGFTAGVDEGLAVVLERLLNARCAERGGEGELAEAGGCVSSTDHSGMRREEDVTEDAVDVCVV